MRDMSGFLQDGTLTFIQCTSVVRGMPDAWAAPDVPPSFLTACFNVMPKNNLTKFVCQGLTNFVSKNIFRLSARGNT